MAKYTDLIFDLYGTLVDIHTEEDALVWEKTALYFSYYGAHYTPEALQKAFEAQIKSRKAQAGQSYECFPDIPFEEIMTCLFEEKGVTENAVVLGIQAAQLFRIASTEYIRPYPGVLESLSALRKAGFRLWLLSNAQAVFTEYELRHLGLTDVFDGIYISSTFGFRKPDRRFFEALLCEQNLDREKCLMIGNDRQTDILGAKNSGLATLYMHTNLTPPEQSCADPTLAPGTPGKHWEYEGSDWEELTQILCTVL